MTRSFKNIISSLNAYCVSLAKSLNKSFCQPIEIYSTGKMIFRLFFSQSCQLKLIFGGRKRYPLTLMLLGKLF